MAKLTETKLKAARPAERPFKLFDAHGLYLLVAPAGGRWWRLRLARDGREQHLSLGTYPEVGLDDARARAAQLRATKDVDAAALANLAAELRGAERPHPVRVASTGDTLEEINEKWRKHVNGSIAASTRSRDERVIGYLLFELGPREPMSAIGIPQFRDALKRIEAKHGREAAGRALRLGRAFWRHAMVNHDHHVKNNPTTAFKANEVLAKLPQSHLAAITDPKVFGGLLRAIDGYNGQPVVRIALQVLALTFQRPGELRLATWAEFDLDSSEPLWTIPAARMKMRESDHTVPLATQTVALLREARQHQRGDFVFPSLRPGQPLSNNTFNAVLRRLDYSNNVHVAHGFRKTASTLLHARRFDKDVIEQQLAHKRPGVEGIYNLSHLLPQRRVLMQAWADYLDELRAMSGIVLELRVA